MFERPDQVAALLVELLVVKSCPLIIQVAGGGSKQVCVVVCFAS